MGANYSKHILFLINNFLYFIVLLVLGALEIELLDFPLGLLVGLNAVPSGSVGLEVAELGLQLPDARIQHGHGVLLGVGQPVLQTSLALGED